MQKNDSFPFDIVCLQYMCILAVNVKGRRTYDGFIVWLTVSEATGNFRSSLNLKQIVTIAPNFDL